MKKSSWITPLVASAIILAGIGLYWQRPQEPGFQGRAVSVWLEDLDDSKPAEAKDQAVEAFRKMGTNAIPALLKILRSWDTGARQKQMVWASQQALIRQQRALKAFAILGPVAAPTLAELLSGDSGLPAARALAHIGPAGVPILCRALTNQNQKIRETVELGLESIGETGKVFVPFLLQNLKDKDEVIRARAAIALGRLAQEPAAAVPALTASLQDSNGEVRLFAAEALGQFGPLAAPAIPALLQASKQGDNRFYRAAFSSLKRIDPDAAKRAGLEP